MRFTELALDKLKFSDSGQRKLRDDLLPGFGLIVGKRTKTFFVMYGKNRQTKTLGQYPQKSLQKARREARRYLERITGRNSSLSLSEAKEEFLEGSEGRLRSSTLERYGFALNNLQGTLENPVLDVDDATTLKTVKIFYNWCIDHDITDRNPFLRRKVVFNRRDRLLTDEEIKAIWHYDHKPYSDIVKVLILSGQRRNQVWKFDESWRSDNVVTFPAAIMKSNRSHVLPIGEYSKYLYEYSFNSWSKAKTRIDKHTGITGWVLHDLRRYFSSTMAKLGTPLHITEQIIDHRSQISGVAAMYNLHTYLDEMKAALVSYEKHTETVIA